MTYTPPERNFENVQHADIRKAIDKKFNDIHDELTDCYYNKKEFKSGSTNYGILDKATYDKLHGLIFHQQAVAFHTVNLMRPVDKRIDEDKYRYEKDENGNIITDKFKDAQEIIKKLKNKGLKLKI